MGNPDDAAPCPEPERLALYLGDCAPAEEDRAVTEHLATGCHRCWGQLATLFTTVAPEPLPVMRYELPVARGLASALGEQRALAAARKEVLSHLIGILRQPSGSLAAAPTTTSRHRWAWCELLLTAVAEQCRADPRCALMLAELAARVAERLTPGDPAPPEVLADLQTRAWIELANARRAANDLPDADTCLAMALDRFTSGTQDRGLLARIVDVAGSLYRYQRRLDQALASLEAATTLYERQGEAQLASRTLVTTGASLIVAGRPDDALASLGRALDLLDADAEPELGLAAVHNSLSALVDAGEAERVFRLLWTVRPLYEEVATSLDKVRLLGIEAKVAQALGQPARAEDFYRREMAGFEDAGLALDAAGVGLDLAGLLLEQHRSAEVLELLDGMVETFAARGVRREATATVLVLYAAIAQGKATVDLLRSVAADLQRIARMPPP